MNPTLSRDPLAAAGYMNKGMAFEQEGIDPSVVLALAQPADKGVFDPMKAATLHQKMMGEV